MWTDPANLVGMIFMGMLMLTSCAFVCTLVLVMSQIGSIWSIGFGFFISSIAMVLELGAINVSSCCSVLSVPMR